MSVDSLVTTANSKVTKCICYHPVLQSRAVTTKAVANIVTISVVNFKFLSQPIRLVQDQDFISKNYPSKLTSAKLNELALESIAQTRHKFLHISWITIDINLNTNLLEFVRSIDPLRTFLLMKLLHSQPLFHHSATANPDKSHSPLFCTASTNVDPIHDPSFQFASALLHTPGSTHSDMDIYSFLTKSNDIPIVLDTGASTSLTLILLDFIGPLEPAPLSEI
jgi:hypothetical protein